MANYWAAMANNLKALYILRENIRSLLRERHISETTLAFVVGHHKTWLNKILNGTREPQFRDLDRIADFFGLATYQLFQPGISPLTERRKLHDRRGGSERRLTPTEKELQYLAPQIKRLREQPHKKRDDV